MGYGEGNFSFMQLETEIKQPKNNFLKQNLWKVRIKRKNTIILGASKIIVCSLPMGIFFQVL